MSGEALQKNERTPGPGEARFTPSMFAALLVRAPFSDLDPADAALVRWAVDEARRWHDAGRAEAPPDILALRFLYRALREKAVAAEPVEANPAAPRWEQVLLAACNLRHRQRSVLALYYCAGLSERDVGRVVGISARQMRTTVEGAVQAVARAIGGPVDVRRSLRMAAGRLATWSPGVAGGQVEDRAPRRVMTALIGPPPAESALAPDRVPDPARGSPAAVGSVTGPAPPRDPATPTQARQRHWRIALAAAAALLVVGILTPGGAGDHVAPPAVTEVGDGTPALAPAPAEPAAVTEEASAAVAGRALVKVRRGDTLWAIAAETLGDPFRWPEIWRLNRGRVMAGGVRFTDPDLIYPTWTLRLPRSGGGPAG